MKTVITAACIAAILAVPAGAAAWSIAGSFEPDTEADVSGGTMYATPDVDPNPTVRKVYFNGVPMLTNGIGGGVNPNSATLQSRIIPPGAFAVMAFLGVWKDCNGDGAVGQLESALFEYRSELLSSTTCPAGGEFNRDGWVYEFLPIGRGDGDAQNDPLRWINDGESQVWADFGRPGHEGEVHFDCSSYPLPSGTTASTGGLLSYADCSTSYSIAGYVNALDPSGTLAFEDPYNVEEDCDHPLNQPIAGGTFGNGACDWGTGWFESGADDPAYVLYDCDAEPIVVEDPLGSQTVTDPTGDQLGLVFGDGITVGIGDRGTPPPRLDAAALNPDGSYVEALGYATSGCETSGQEFAIVGQLLEADFEGSNPGIGKRQADFPLAFGENPSTFWTLGFFDIRRGNLCEPYISGTCIGPVITDTFGNDTPGSLGVTALATSGNTFVSEWPVWSTGVIYTPPGYYGNTIRGDGQAAGAKWFTFYARVGTTTSTSTQLLASAPSSYGSEACGSFSSGVREGWDCAPDHWWNPAMGGTDYATYLADGDAPRPGMPYHLRDNDCYDGQLASGTPAYASGALVSYEGTCE